MVASETNTNRRRLFKRNQHRHRVSTRVRGNTSCVKKIGTSTDKKNGFFGNRCGSFNFFFGIILNKIKQWYAALGTGFLLILQFNCAGHFLGNASGTAARKQLEAVRSFAIVYKKAPLEELTGFDLLILDPDAYDSAAFGGLTRRGKIVLGYLNVGEVETYRWYASEVPPNWVLKANPNWPHHNFVNVKKRGWRKLVVQKIARRILQKGAQGFFLDSVDLASPARNPHLKSAMVKLIRQLHGRYPTKFLLLNNGQFLLPEVASAVSGLAVENVFTEPEEQTVRHRPAGQVRRILENLKSLKEKYRLPIFLVDYFPQNGEVSVADWEAIARTYGMVLYVGDTLLQRVSPPF